MRHCMSMYGWIWPISVAQYKELWRNICRVRVVCSNGLGNGIWVRQQVDSHKYVRISKNMWVGKIIFGVTRRWQLYFRKCTHISKKDFIFLKVKFDETKENLVTTKKNVCRFRMKNFSKQANFFKGICKKALLMISKFIDLGSLMHHTPGCCPKVQTNAKTNVTQLGAVRFNGVVWRNAYLASTHLVPTTTQSFSDHTILERTRTTRPRSKEQARRSQTRSWMKSRAYRI